MSFCLRRTVMVYRRTVILLTLYHYRLSSYRRFDYVVSLSFIVVQSFPYVAFYRRSVILLMSYFIALPPFSLRRAIVVYRRNVILLTLCHCRASSHCYFAYVVPLLFIVAPLFYLGYVYVVSLPFIVEPLFCLRRITVVYRRTVIFAYVVPLLFIVLPSFWLRRVFIVVP